MIVISPQINIALALAILSDTITFLFGQGNTVV